MEMRNIEKAMEYIQQTVEFQKPITEIFVRELHQITVQGLIREGDSTPGAYRNIQVRIALSQHLPPDFFEVPQYMSELVAFINRDDPS
jgi:Fic family protein